MARLPKACNPEANRRRPCRPLFHAAAFSLPWKGLERRGKLTIAVIAVLMTLNASQVKKPRKVAATPNFKPGVCRSYLFNNSLYKNRGKAPRTYAPLHALPRQIRSLAVVTQRTMFRAHDS